LPIVKSVKLDAPEKILVPSSVTVSGIMKLVKLEHPAKAQDSISVMLFVKINSSKLVQFQNNP